MGSQLFARVARVLVASAVLVAAVTGSAAVRPTAAALVCSVVTPCYAFTVAMAGEGEATVTTSTGGIDCTLAGSVQSGTCTTKLFPNTTFSIYLDLNETCYDDGIINQCSGTGHESYTTSPSGANEWDGKFSYFNAFYVVVQKSGTGTGRVSSKTFPGIDCGSTCAAYLPGESQYMLAVPDSGSVFVDWSGGCTGTDTLCNFDQPLQNIVARFDKATPPPTATPKPSATPKPTAKPTATPPTVTPSPTATPENTPAATVGPKPTAGPSATPEPSAAPATVGPPPTSGPPTEPPTIGPTASNPPPTAAATPAEASTGSGEPASGASADGFPIGPAILLVVIVAGIVLLGWRFASRRK